MSRSGGFIRRLDETGVPLLLARLGVGGAFAYLAVLKLLADPFDFLKLIRQYGFLPTEPPIYLNATAALLPWLELVCAAALVLGVGVRGSALVVNGMLAFFSPMLLTYALHKYHNPPAGESYQTLCDVCFKCGCGPEAVCICRKLAENIALQIGALWALFSASRRWCLSALLLARHRQPRVTVS